MKRPRKAARQPGGLSPQVVAVALTRLQSDYIGILDGSTFWIRWLDSDASGADDGLAIDDFSLTPQGASIPEPSSMALAGLGAASLLIFRRRK